VFERRTANAFRLSELVQIGGLGRKRAACLIRTATVAPHISRERHRTDELAKAVRWGHAVLVAKLAEGFGITVSRP